MTKSDDGHEVIEVRVRARSQLFNSLDPAPFLERDLDDEAEAYIVGWARELPAAAPLRLMIYLPADEASRAIEEGVPAAIANYFAIRADTFRRDLADNFALGWRYLAVGLPVLIICLMSSQIARQSIASETIARIAEESLIIVGWVANWRPIETFLYAWWPLARKIRLYRRLQNAEVKVVGL